MQERPHHRFRIRLIPGNERKNEHLESLANSIGTIAVPNREELDRVSPGRMLGVRARL